MKISDVVSFEERKVKVRAVLNYLYNHGKIEDKSGRATTILYGGLDHIGLNLKNMNTLTNLMQEAGWIKKEVRGKRTFLIELVDFPEDWEPTEQVEEVLLAPVVEPGPSLNPEPEMGARQEADELGMRPGRLAARLEKQIPGMVQEAVANALMGLLQTLIPPREIVVHDDSATSKIEALESRLAGVEEDLRVEQQMHDATRSQLNTELRRSYTISEGSPLGPSDMQEAYRDLARHAINHGWTISRTSGSHFRWRSPVGKVVFTGSSDSDWRSVRNTRADLENAGMPKQ